jgi:hypothetical protein
MLRTSRARGLVVLPKPSLELSRNGMALGRLPGLVHHPSNGPGATPARAIRLNVRPRHAHLHTLYVMKRVVSLALAAGFATYAISQTQAEPQFGIKEAQPRVGSNIKRYSVPPINIPINRSFAELSPEERKRWQAAYEEIKDGDEPPFPVDGLKAILEPLTKAQQKLLVQGNLFLIATIGPNGEAEQVKAIGSPSPSMPQVAAQILLLTKYKPAVCSGQPCKMYFPLRLSFVVR